MQVPLNDTTKGFQYTLNDMCKYLNEKLDAGCPAYPYGYCVKDCPIFKLTGVLLYGDDLIENKETRDGNC